MVVQHRRLLGHITTFLQDTGNVQVGYQHVILLLFFRLKSIFETLFVLVFGYLVERSVNAEEILIIIYGNLPWNHAVTLYLL